MTLAVGLYKPKYEENIGYACRAMANFGFNDLRLIEPRANPTTGKARSRAMHGLPVLKKAKTYKSLGRALKGFDFVVGTSAKTKKPGKLGRQALSIAEFAERFPSAGGKSKILLLFGPEENGLENEQLEKCDFLVHIPTKREYKALSLGHAVAICVYEMARKRDAKFTPMTEDSKRRILGMVDVVVGNTEGVRDKKAVNTAFRELLGRAPATEKEARAVMALFSGLKKELGKRKP